MRVFEVENAHKGYPEVLRALIEEGERKDSRVGNVIKFKTPVTIVFKNPLERIVSYEQRNANPFFHFAESMWMLAGRDDLNYVKRFVLRMEEFSDDGKKLHGAYGARWNDQLEAVIKQIKKDGNDRRIVIQLWDKNKDGLGRTGKDFPCNMMVLFAVNNGSLDMTVYNRSNDIIWGTFGANCVHFSYLHEYVAQQSGYPVGKYYQVSNNMHVYEERLERLGVFKEEPSIYDEGYSHLPMVLDRKQLIDKALDGEIGGDNYIGKVVQPIIQAHNEFKQKNFDRAYRRLEGCKDGAWMKACKDWLIRKEQELDNGVRY